MADVRRSPCVLGPSDEFGTPREASNLEGLRGEALWTSHMSKELLAGAL